MKKENSSRMLKRVAFRGAAVSIVLLLVIFVFTKSLLYCIIFLIGSGISFFGYFLMIRAVDRVIKRSRGKGLFILTGLGKMILISAVFILVSKYSEQAVLFYLLGLSVIVLSVIIEGGSQIFWSSKDGT